MTKKPSKPSTDGIRVNVDQKKPRPRQADQPPSRPKPSSRIPKKK